MIVCKNNAFLNQYKPSESQTRSYAVEDKQLFSRVSSQIHNVVLKLPRALCMIL